MFQPKIRIAVPDIEVEEREEKKESQPKLEIDDKQAAGDVGATSNYTVEIPIEPAKKSKPNLFSASSKPRGPKFGLQIDIAKIDELYNYGGEHAEMREDKAMEKLE